MIFVPGTYLLHFKDCGTSPIKPTSLLVMLDELRSTHDLGAAPIP